MVVVATVMAVEAVAADITAEGAAGMESLEGVEVEEAQRY